MATKKNSAKKSSAKPKKGSNLGYAEPKKKSAKKVVKKITRKPRAQRLPGMEDGAIQTLENLANDYADVRDQRIALSKKEGPLKKDLLAEMKRLKKEHYQHGRLMIDIVHESEDVKVKVLKEETEEFSYEEPDDEPEDVEEESPELAVSV